MTPHELVSEHIQTALAASPAPDAAGIATRAGRVSQVLRPAGALQRLDDLAIWFAGWNPSASSDLSATCLVFASDHGVAQRGVSAYPAEVTMAMKAAIDNNSATSTALAKTNGADLTLIDVGVGRPTKDFTEEDALDHERFREAWFSGVEAVQGQSADVLVLGELGIGNTTAAAAVAAGVIGGTGSEWVGRGTGIDDDGLVRKALVVDAGLARLGERRNSPVDVLAGMGGAELVAMAGAAVEARRTSQPLILDGFIATSALLALHKLSPGFLDHAVAGHRSAEQGHIRMLEWLGKQPILQLDMRLGEASGALVALSILRSAVASVLDVATFAEAGVPGPG